MERKYLYELYESMKALPYFTYREEARIEGIRQEIMEYLYDEFIEEYERDHGINIVIESEAAGHD